MSRGFNMKWLTVLLFTVVLFSGCSGGLVPSATPIPTVSLQSLTLQSCDCGSEVRRLDNVTGLTLWCDPLLKRWMYYNEWWGSPVEIPLRGFTSGSRVDTYSDSGEPLAIYLHNGKDYQVKFTIAYQRPLRDLRSGYMTAPMGADKWVTFYGLVPVSVAREVQVNDQVVEVYDQGIVLGPYETKRVPFSLEAPRGTLLPDSWEFWIMVLDMSGGFAALGGQTRVLVSR